MTTKSYDSITNDYLTPLDSIVYKLMEFARIVKFSIDVCCSCENIPAHVYFKKGIRDGLKQNWFKICFLNPPWNQTEKWLNKAFEVYVHW